MPLNNPEPGLGSVSEYQASALPWVTSSVVTTSASTKYSFQKVTSFITVRSLGPGSVSLMFTENGYASGNKYTIPSGSSETFRLRLKEFFTRAEGSNATVSVLAGLTFIPAGFMPVLTGSIWEGVG